jgi:hypothetical protein
VICILGCSSWLLAAARAGTAADMCRCAGP